MVKVSQLYAVYFVLCRCQRDCRLRVYVVGEICGRFMNAGDRVVQLEIMLGGMEMLQMLFYRKQTQLNQLQVSLCEVHGTCKRAKKHE